MARFVRPLGPLAALRLVPEEFATLDGEAAREEASGRAARRERVNVDRRDFLKKSGAVVAGGLLADLGIFEQAAGAARRTNGRPNIVFILVDEMRFPSVFPSGVRTPAEFLRRYMPNVFYLWQHGVKFESYYSSGNACSPARATIATGLYPHQQWLLATRTTSGPALQPGFPTYGKLLRQFGYQTPYVGKWHLSNPLLGRLAGGLLRESVQEPVTAAVQRQLRDCPARSQPEAAGVSGDPAELGVVRGPAGKR